MNFLFYYHCLRKDLTNFSFIRHAGFSGFIVSMHQSGTHWLKHMIASAICREHGLPMPKFNHANDIIGGAKTPLSYPDIHRLGSSHTILNPLLHFRGARNLVQLPDYVVLIRDIRSSLISNYEKWKHVYKCEFSEYLKGDVSGRRFNHDLWWCIRFLNSWGRQMEKFPDSILIVKYEEIKSGPVLQLKRINGFFRLGLAEASLQFGIEASSKENMRLKDDPERPGGAIRTDNTGGDDFFSPATARRYPPSAAPRRDGRRSRGT